MRARKAVEVAPVRVLLRHADAGIRAEWLGNDEWRGLSPLGWDQAEEVARRLDGLPLLRVLSSPSLRCRQTVVPLARGLVLDVEPERRLAIDANPERLLRFLRNPETASSVLCTHRETLEALFQHLALDHTAVPAGSGRMDMTAAWMVQEVAGEPGGFHVRHLPARRVGGTVVPAGSDA